MVKEICIAKLTMGVEVTHWRSAHVPLPWETDELITICEKMGLVAGGYDVRWRGVACELIDAWIARDYGYRSWPDLCDAYPPEILVDIMDNFIESLVPALHKTKVEVKYETIQ